MGSDQQDAEETLSAFYEYHRSVVSLWSDLIVKYYAGEELSRNLVTRADSSVLCHSKGLFAHKGCKLLKLECNTNTCSATYEKACTCHSPVSWIPGFYLCEHHVVTPLSLIKSLADNGADPVHNFSGFKRALNLSDDEVENPLLIRPEANVIEGWPRYHMSLYDLVGKSGTTQSIVDLRIPVGRCVFNSFLPLYVVLATVASVLLLYYPIRMLVKRKSI